MTYPLNRRLFIENGPAAISAAARSRRSSALAFQAIEQARLEAARTVIGSDIPLAA